MFFLIVCTILSTLTGVQKLCRITVRSTSEDVATEVRKVLETVLKGDS